MYFLFFFVLVFTSLRKKYIHLSNWLMTVIMLFYIVLNFSQCYMLWLFLGGFEKTCSTHKSIRNIIFTQITNIRCGKIINKLNKETNAALADQGMKARLAELGCTVLPGSPADFGKLIADETAKWGKVIRAANIKAE